VDDLNKMLEDLGLNDYDSQTGKNNSLVVDLGSDSEFGKVYSTLEVNDDVE
jgi:hypothetical protein